MSKQEVHPLRVVPLFLCIVVKVQDILDIIQDVAPSGLAQAWDNLGLLVGSPDNPVTSILLALDPTVSLIAEAEKYGAELIITHHPAIFHPLKSLRTDHPVGNFICSAVQAGISVIGCHTNFDAVCGGVSDVLARLLGVVNAVPLIADPSNRCGKKCGVGRIGTLPEAVSTDSFIADIYKAISPPWLLEAGPRPDTVFKVAVCGGSCSDLSETALSAGADVFITSEIKHDVARWAEEAGLWLIDGGHFATENPAIRQGLQKLLTDKCRELDMNVRVHIGRQEAPLRLVKKRG